MKSKNHGSLCTDASSVVKAIRLSFLSKLTVGNVGSMKMEENIWAVFNFDHFCSLIPYSLHGDHHIAHHSGKIAKEE